MHAHIFVHDLRRYETPTNAMAQLPSIVQLSVVDAISKLLSGLGKVVM
jgi:hypothetical protein